MDNKTREKTLPATEDFRANDDKDAHSIVDTIDHAAEKKVLRKVDLNLITIFGLRRSCSPNKCIAESNGHAQAPYILCRS